MKALSNSTAKTFLLTVAIFCGALLISSAQTTADADIKEKEAELEKQKLEHEKAKQDVQYQEGGKSMSMNLAGDVLFDYEKAVLKPAAEEALKKVSIVLSLFPESNVTVEGYTDSKGGQKINLQLSQERATSGKDWLVKNGGVAPKHISAPNVNTDGSDNVVGRAKNRRVTIVVDKPVTAPAP